MATIRRVTRRDALLAGAGLVGTLAALGGGADTLARYARLGNDGDSDLPDEDDNENPNDDPQWEGVEAAFSGTEGQLQPDGVFLIDLPRSDKTWYVEGYHVDPEFQFDQEITFQPIGGNNAFVKYDIMTLQTDEAQRVISALLKMGLTCTAEHIHLFDVTPRPAHVHGWAKGDRNDIAKRLRYVIDQTTTPIPAPPSTPGNPGFDFERVEHTIGGEGTLSSGVLDVSVPRKDQFVQESVTLKPSNQMQNDFRFYSVGSGRVVATSEMPVLPSEADRVTAALRSYGVQITDLHNHELQINPMVFWLHGFAAGDPYAIASAFRAALAQTNSAPSSGQ